MSLHEQIKKEIPEALKAKDAVRLRTLRGLSAAFTNAAVAARKKPDSILSDEDALAVVRTEARKRKDSIEQFQKGGRDDLVAAERAELAVLETYLPALMPAEDIEKVVKQKQAALGITGPSQKGKLIGAVMKELGGNADGNEVRAIVETLLG